ncbi:site-specific integrase [Pseudactinotalea sp. HY160]|uniref:tyrosine-type recombinase/integrase n=1 Tax=Pseudactinotalea sp. HY160 TaxID=2654490 RepID=UPI001883704B|nr:site-specific integrase [Pseudactinotalea sp. HY160]
MTHVELVLETIELLGHWELEMASRRLSPRTIKERVRFVRYLDATLGPAVHLGEDDLRSFLADCSRTKAATTQFNYHVVIRMWFQWLQQRGFRTDDPTISLGTPRLPRMQPRPALTDHLDAVLRAGNLEVQTKMKVLLAALQGMRCIEISRLRGEDVDLAAMRIRIIGKGDTDITNDLHSTVADHARAHGSYFPRRGWWFPSPIDPSKHVLPASVSKVLSEAFRRVGAPVTAHQLRHWTATELIRKDVPTRVVQKIMRHSSIQTTEGYSAVADDTSAAALRRLPSLIVGN